MDQLSISLLGPYHVTFGDQAQVHFEYDKVRALLAYLAVESDRPLRREFLAGLLWPEQPEAAALKSLRQAILKLRQAIGDAALHPHFLDINRESLQINPHCAYTLDVRTLITLLDTTRHHQHRNPKTCPSCAGNRTQAVMLYRGDFLDQFSLRDCPEFESWIVVKREQFRNLILRALTSLSDFHLRKQEYDLAQHYATQQIEIDPLQEEAYRQMMIALGLDNKRTAALKCYAVCRRLLEKELDIEPEEETEKLYHLIKAGLFKDYYLDVISDHTRLPLPPSPFFGRERELAGVAALLESPHTHLIALTGPGGVGKTSLALKVASDYEKLFTHGACFVPLAQLDSADDIYRAIAVVLNISLQGNLDDKTQLFNYLARKEMLIILDNVEHLLPAGTEKINALLFAARQVVIILTTTARINLAFEYVFPILGLDFPNVDTIEESEHLSAVDLFTHHALRNGVVLQEQDFFSINRICRLFEGNPLAIVLAASLLRSLSCSEVAKGIEEGIDLLTTSRSDIPERQKSFRALYDYSWNHLSEKEQSQFRKLSVFRGGFQREAAQQVADASLSDLAGLIDRSFLRKNQTDRYRIHGLLQQYAYQKLEQSNENNQTLLRHMAYFVEFAHQASLQVNQAQPNGWLIHLDREMGNLRMAFQTAQAAGESGAEFALRLAGALGRYWEQRGFWREGKEWFTIALSMGEKDASIPVDIKIKALFWAGILASYLGENYKLDELAHRGLTLFHQDPAHHNQAPMLILLGILKRNEGDYSSAKELFQESLELFKKADDRWGTCISLNNLFRIDYRQNAYKEATVLAKQSLALAREAGDQWNIAHALDFLGIVAHDQGNYEHGKTYLNESLAISRSIGARFMIGHAIYWLGRIARSQTNPELARILFEESLAHYREIGGKWGIAVSLQGLGTVALDEEDYARAEKLLLDSLAVLQEVGDTQLLAYVKIHLGDVAGAIQKYDRAISLYQESLKALIAIEDQWSIALAIGGMASVATGQREFSKAAILLGIEAEIRNKIGTPRSPAENVVFKRSLCTLRNQISGWQLHAFRREGKYIARRSPAEVIKYVLLNVPLG
jgi:predicted ATPase/DNA-binding SARP family transcriptional activator